MKINKILQVCSITILLTLSSVGVARADLNNSDNAFAMIGDSQIAPISGEENYRYIGESAINGNMYQTMVTTRAARFIGRVDAHNAHTSGSEVSGHVSWTLISGTNRKMEVKSTLKAKTGWFGYSTKASSGKVSVWPGGGRGKSVVARYRCNGAKSTKWYTYGEGFAPGTQKPWGYHNGTVVTLACGA